MDPHVTTVVGSRYPVTVPVASTSAHMRKKSHISLSISHQPIKSPPSSRRKPIVTYKSPSVHDNALVRKEDKMQSPSTPSSQKTTTTDIVYSISGLRGNSTLRAKQPPLPLYHPHGTLALSLPELDPSVFGHPSSVTIDDNDTPIDDSEAGRRATGRSRRPAAKVRDRDDGEGSTVNGATPGQDQGDTRANPSPRKRRAGAGGAGGKRRRKDQDDGDGTYPQPPRRTRNPRGAAAITSPLSGPAVAADPSAEGATAHDATEVNDSHQDTPEVPEPRPNTRARRPRNTRRRRGSSASETTSTSVSVSIATNTRVTRAANAKATKAQTEEDSQEPTPQKGGDEAEPDDAMDEDHPPDSVPETPMTAENAEQSKPETKPTTKAGEQNGTVIRSIEGELLEPREKVESKEEGEVSEGSN